MAKKGFLLGAILGSIAGGVTALLYAPKVGKQMRKDLSKKYIQIKGKTVHLVDSISEKTSDLMVKAKDLADDAKVAANTIIKEAQSTSSSKKSKKSNKRSSGRKKRKA